MSAEVVVTPLPGADGLSAAAIPSESILVKRKTLVRNIALLFGSQAASWSFALVWTLVVPRLLGPAVMGQLVIAWAITGVVGTIVGLGVTTLVTKDVARRPENASALVGAALWTRIVVIAPAVMLVLIYVFVVGFDNTQTLVILIASGVMVVNLFGGVLIAALTGLEKMQYVAYNRLFTAGLGAILGIALVLAGFRAIGVVALTLFLSATLLYLSFHWSRRHFRVTLTPNLPLIRRLIVDGLPLWIGAMVFSVYLAIDSIILGALAPATVVGWYGVPTQMFSAILVVPAIIINAWFPRLSKAFVDGQANLHEEARPVIEVLLVIAIPASAGLAAVSGPLIHALYGSRFDPAAPVLFVLAVTVLPTFLNIAAYYVLLAADRQMTWIKVIAVTAVINPVLNLILIPYFQHRTGNGALGAAISLLATEVLQAAAAVWLLRWMGLSVLRRPARALLAAAAMTLLVVVAGPLGLLVQIAIGIGSFAVLGIVLRLLSDSEWAFFGSLAPRQLRRFGFRRIGSPS
jgi:O-antigen/teichoic acid export membrane protein